MKILVISSKNSYVAKRLLAEAKKMKLGIDVLPANKLAGLSLKDYDCLYIRSPYINRSPRYIPNIISLAKRFKKVGKKVVDSSIISGRLGQGKWADYQRLMKAGLPIPETKILSRRTIPKAWPFILKWVYGFKAKNVFLVQNQKQFNRIFAKYPKGELLVQEFIPAEYEYKVITVGYKALPIVLRFAIHPVTKRPDFSTACSVPIYGRLGSPMNRHATRLISIVQKASKALGRELAKVDILESRGKFYILEVNRFPGLDSFEKLAKYNVAKAFLEYLARAQI